MITWIEDNCVFCNEINWVNCGNISDITGYDVDGFICWKCKKKNIFEDCEGDNFEEGYNRPS